MNYYTKRMNQNKSELFGALDWVLIILFKLFS